MRQKARAFICLFFALLITSCFEPSASIKINSFNDSPYPFSPNGDSIADTTTLTASITANMPQPCLGESYEISYKWIIKSSDGTGTLKELSGRAPLSVSGKSSLAQKSIEVGKTLNITWDGANASGVIVSAGIYPYSFKVELIKHWKEGFCKKQQVVASSSEVSGNVTVQLGTPDTDSPMVSITNPLNGAKLDMNTPTITIAYSDDGSGVDATSLRVWLDGNDVSDKFTANADEAYWDISLDDALDEGEHSVHASIADKAGNSADAVPVRFLVNADKPVETVESGWLDGIVYNSRTDEPIENAQITVNGVDGNLFTNADGKYFFPTPTGGWYQIEISALGYTSQYREVWVTPTRDVAIDPAYLVPVDSAVTHIVASEGGTAVNSNNTVQVIIPAGAAPYDIDVTATWYEAAKELPMDLPKYSHFTMAFDLKPDGVVFNQPVKIRAKNVREFEPGTPVPVGYFDKEKLAWRHDGTAYVSDDGKWVEYEQTHFSSYDWNHPWLALCGSGGCLYPDIIALIFGGANNELGSCPASKVGFHSGKLEQWHDTASYVSQSVKRYITFIYDSKRARPETIPITIKVNNYSENASIWKVRASLEGVSYNVTIDGGLYVILLKNSKTLKKTIEKGVSYSRILFKAVNARGKPLLPGTYTTEVSYTFRYPTIPWALGTIFGRRSDISLVASGPPEPLELTTTTTARVAVNSLNLSDSPYGAGWNISGIDRIFPQDPDSNSFLYAEGDGGYKIARFGSYEEEKFSSGVYEDSLVSDKEGNLFLVKYVSCAYEKPLGMRKSFGSENCYQHYGVDVFSPSGVKTETSVSANGFGGMALDSDGNIFIIDSQSNAVDVWNAGGTSKIGSIQLNSDACQKGLAADGKGNVYVGGCVISKLRADLSITEFSEETPAFPIVVDKYDRLIGQGDDGKLYRYDEYGFAKPYTVALPLFKSFTLDGQNFIHAILDNANRIYRISPIGETETYTTKSVAGQIVALTYVNDSNPHLAAFANYPSWSIFNLYMNMNAELPPEDTGTLKRDIYGNFVYRYANGVEKLFNAAGLMTAIKDTNGNTTHYELDNNGVLTSIIDPAGLSTVFQYDSNGRLARIIDPAGRATIFNVNAAGDLVSITDPDSAVNYFDYSDHLMTRKDCSSCGYSSNYYYGEYGEIVRTVDAVGAERKYEPGFYKGFPTDTSMSNPAELTTAEDLRSVYTDALGRITRFESDTNGNTIYESDPLGRETTTEYNDRNKPVKINNPGGINYQYSYDAPGNLISAVNETAGATVEFEYEPLFNKVTLARDPLGRETHFIYDDRGNLIEARDAAGNSTTFSYNSTGQLLTATDPMGAVTTFAYDAFGNLESITDALGNVTAMARDAAGNIISITDALGNISSFAYDSMNRRTSYTDALGYMTYFAYDSKGRLIQVTDAMGGITSFEYNAVGLLTEKTDPLGRVTQYAYDLERNLVNITDPAGRVTSYSYDDLDRLIAATNPMNFVTSYGYDAAGNLASVTDAKGNQTTYGYNAFGRVTSVTDALGYVKQYEYDLAQNLTRAVYPKGNELAYYYDNINRLTSKEVLNSAENIEDQYNYIYDNNGNLLSASNYNSYLEFAYDPLGRTVMAATNPTGNYSTPSAMFYYNYDAAGNRISMTDPNGGITNYSYDNRNLLTEILNPYGELTQYAYDTMGRRSSFMRANGVETTYAYDAASQVTAIDHLLGGTALDYFHYAYDQVGNRTNMTRPEGIHEYTYDDLDRLTGATHPWPDLPTESFGYDPLGNRLGNTVDAGNRLLEDDDWTYSYDANGNMIGRVGKTKPESWYYYYNGEDRMVEAYKYTIDGTGNEIPDSYSYYEYDALMNRIGKRVYTNCDANWNCDENGQYYVYTDEDVWGVYDFDWNLKYEITHGPGIDEPISLRENSNSHYYLTDILGTVWNNLDASGLLENLTSYSSYGVPIQNNPAADWESLFKYTGREFDQETGFSYHRFRYYMPEAGRFNGEDPIAHSPNQYSYALENPVFYTDKTGMIIDTIADIGFIGHDLYSLLGHLARGQKQEADIDRVALAADVAGAMIPFVGGLGLSIREINAEMKVLRTENNGIKSCRRLGELGEQYIRETTGMERTYEQIPSLTGTAKHRVPDNLINEIRLVHETKNVDYLRMTPQIKDYMLWADKEGYKLVISIRENTRISKEILQAASENRLILNRVLP